MDCRYAVFVFLVMFVISLIFARKITKNMQMLNMICEHLGLQMPTADQEVQDMAQTTPVTALAEEIEKAREVGESLLGDVGKCPGRVLGRQ